MMQQFLLLNCTNNRFESCRRICMIGMFPATNPLLPNKRGYTATGTADLRPCIDAITHIVGPFNIPNVTARNIRSEIQWENGSFTVTLFKFGLSEGNAPPDKSQITAEIRERRYSMKAKHLICGYDE